MDQEVKDQIKKWGGKIVWVLVSSTGVLGAVWMMVMSHVDTYIDSRIHKHHSEDIRIGIVIRDGKEWYIGPDGKDHTVIHGADGFRWWYDGDEMKQIYK